MFKKSFLFATIAILITCTAGAQAKFLGRTWFKPPVQQMRGFTLSGITVKGDTTFYQLKPIVGLAYSFPNNVAQAVTGLSYQHISYKYQTQDSPDQSYCDYSFNLLYSLGTTSTPKLITESPSSFGAGVGVLNNTIMACILFNSYKDKLKPDDKQKLKPVVAIMYTF